MDCIDTGYDNAFMNMAIDEVLLSSREPVLRLYQWEPGAVSIGRFQDLGDIDVDFCHQSRIDIVRRITGGKSVLHEKELTYSFIVDRNRMPRSIIESYNIISSAIILGLRELGIDPEMSRAKVKSRRNPVCFQEPSFNEIVLDRKKVVGSAQTRRKGKVLQHGSILTGMDIEKHASCFMKKPDMGDLKKRITSIDVPERELKSAITYGFSTYFGITMNKRDLTSAERRDAGKLAEEKYQSREWTERYCRV